MLKWLRTLLTDVLKATDSYDIRRYLAIILMAGGSIVMTGLVIYIIPMLAGKAGYLFWIAISAMILIGLQQTGFIALIAKRSIVISREHITIDDDEVREEIKQQAQDIKDQATDIQEKV